MMSGMGITKPRIVSCSAKGLEECENIAIYQSFHKLKLPYELKVVHSNIEPLPVVYNREIRNAIADGVDWLFLIHDDVVLLSDPIRGCELGLDRGYDLIGVAGTSKISLTSPALWHLMSSRGHLHGMVYHDIGDQRFPTMFGRHPHQAVMIDGVFMALGPNVLSSNVRFDENIPSGFHFYDLDFSLSCHLQGLKVGVESILIAHQSGGLKEFTPEWTAGEEYFLKKHI